MSETKQQHGVYHKASDIPSSSEGLVPSSLDFDMNLDIPIEELVKSLMSCGDKIRHEIYNMQGRNEHFMSYNRPGSVMRSLIPTADEESTSSESGRSSYSYPRFDSPYREKGKWPRSQATYFLRQRAGSTSRPVSTIPGSTLSANAPVFTPLSERGNQATPGDLWELPGLPSPMMEFSEAPTFDSQDICNNYYPKDMGTSVSILQRGLSSIAIGGKYLHL